ncbi:MAG: hypothetical protein IJ849_11035 [Selenomonadaceae bacterium]|nr:hypothetical protein [Selenomonadaceae bacterium]
MRRKINIRLGRLGAVLLLTALVMSLAIAPGEAAKKRVAVMPLEKLFVLSDSTRDEETVAKIMADQLVVALQESGIYTVVEREQFDKAMQEQGFQNLYADPDYAVEMGKAFGAQQVVVGKITMVKTKKNQTRGFFNKVRSGFDTPYRTNIALELRLVDCQDSHVVLAKTVDGDRGGNDEESSLYNACRHAAEVFMRAVQVANPFTGRVIEIQGSDIYIDQGENSGIRKGEELLVVREGTPLMSGGQIIGMTQTEVGKVKVTAVNGEFSVCRAAGSFDIQKGDVVKRAAK